MSPRSLLVAAVLLVCAFVATASASAVDTSFGSPSLQADSWPSMIAQDAHSVAAEVLARHQEFLFEELSATGAESSSTGAPGFDSSSSSTGVPQPYNLTTYAPAKVTFNLGYNRTTVPLTLDEDFANATATATRYPRRLINAAHSFVNSKPIVRRRSALVHFMRRVNADGTEEVTQMILTITPLNITDSSASVFATMISTQLACTGTEEEKTACAKAAAQVAGLDASAPTMFDNAAVNEMAASIDVKSFQVEKGETVTTFDPSADNGHLIPSSGTARDTNIGYYVLGAVLAFFVAAALVYFIAHKAPVAKEEPVLVERRAPAVALEEIPRSAAAAPADAVAVPVAADADAAASSGVQTVDEPAAGQMDYKSVFALKHNVLDKKDDADATAAAPADDNDVHFVLHQ